MAKAKYITVGLDNRPGTLAHLAKVLGDAKVNIVALLATTTEQRGAVQVIVDNANRAKKALNAANLGFQEGTVEIVDLPNRPGALAEVAGRLAKKGINIDAAYATAPRVAKKAMLVLTTSGPRPM